MGFGVSFPSALHYVHCTAENVFILLLILFLDGWCVYLVTKSGLSHHFCKKTSDFSTEDSFLFPSLSCSKEIWVHKYGNQIDSAWWHLSLAKVCCGSNHKFSFSKQRQGWFPKPPWQNTRRADWIFLDSCLDLSLFWQRQTLYFSPRWLLLDSFLCQHLFPVFSKEYVSIRYIYMHIVTNLVPKPFWGYYLQSFIVPAYEFQPFKALAFFDECVCWFWLG